jgi:hypothetical protein
MVLASWDKARLAIEQAEHLHAVLEQIHRRPLKKPAFLPRTSPAQLALHFRK